MSEFTEYYVLIQLSATKHTRVPLALLFQKKLNCFGVHLLIVNLNEKKNELEEIVTR